MAGERERRGKREEKRGIGEGKEGGEGREGKGEEGKGGDGEFASLALGGIDAPDTFSLIMANMTTINKCILSYHAAITIKYKDIP